MLGFFAFLGGANAVNATIMWFELGPTSTFRPYLLGELTGAIPVYVYLLISTLVTLGFLGATCHKTVSEFSIVDLFSGVHEKTNRLQAGQESQRKVLDGVQARVFLVDESVERTRRELSKGFIDQGERIKRRMAGDHQDQRKMLDDVKAQVFLLDGSLNGVRKGLGDQAELIKGINRNLMDAVGSQLAYVKEVLVQLELRDKETVAAIAKQTDEIATIKFKLESLEDAVVTPKPLLTSQSSVEYIKGIGPRKGSELKEIGITSAGDLIMADPKVLAEKMGSSDKTVEKLQGRAQLSMIPGLKSKDLGLLEDLDITNRRSLAAQDSIELSKKIYAIFRENHAKGKVAEADLPTFEEIYTWVKSARS